MRSALTGFAADFCLAGVAAGADVNEGRIKEGVGVAGVRLGMTADKLCAPCHRIDGGGLVGPNLCDDYWIHGSNFVDNLRVIWNGVPAKGMVTWKATLDPKTIYATASYAYKFRGTSPPNPKPPENTTPAQTGPSEFE